MSWGGRERRDGWKGEERDGDVEGGEGDQGRERRTQVRRKSYKGRDTEA